MEGKNVGTPIQLRKRQVPLRLLAVRLSEAAAQRAQQRRKRHARKNGVKSQPMSIQVADWMVLLSSLPVESWSAEQVLALDRARWQIELLFKRIKQLVRLHRLRSADLQSNQAVMAAVLVGWALMEAQATKLRRQIQAQRSSQGPAAHQQLAALCSVDPEPTQHAAGKVELGADPDASGCPHRLVDGSSPTASSSGEPDQ